MCGASGNLDIGLYWYDTGMNGKLGIKQVEATKKETVLWIESL